MSTSTSFADADVDANKDPAGVRVRRDRPAGGAEAGRPL